MKKIEIFNKLKSDETVTCYKTYEMNDSLSPGHDVAE